MLKKNIEREERKNRPLWNGYYTRKTPTKKEKMNKLAKKHRQPLYADQDKDLRASPKGDAGAGLFFRRPAHGCVKQPEPAEFLSSRDE